jgi:hypothetical protein
MRPADRISKELLEQVFTNDKLSLEEKTRVLDCSNQTMYRLAEKYGLYTIKKRLKSKKKDVLQLVLEEIEAEPEPEPEPIFGPKVININITFGVNKTNKDDIKAALELLLEQLQ